VPEKPGSRSVSFQGIESLGVTCLTEWVRCVEESPWADTACMVNTRRVNLMIIQREDFRTPDEDLNKWVETWHFQGGPILGIRVLVEVRATLGDPDFAALNHGGSVPLQ